jgi:hypothetical protein
MDGWLDAPSVLDTLLALCEPPGWDLSPPQRMGRRNAATNVLRLWSLLDQIGTEPGARLERVDVQAPEAMWDWQNWRHHSSSVRDPHFEILLVFSSGELRLRLLVEDAPQLERTLKVRRTPPGKNTQARPSWLLEPAGVAMAYPQARAFIAALSFSTTPEVFAIRSAEGSADV